MTYWGGLDLDRLDELTEQERREFTEFYVGRFGHPHAGLEYMLDERPDALKRFRRYVYGYEANEPARKYGFTFFVYYVFIGYEAGLRYALRARQKQGLTRAQARDAIAMAFLRSGPYGGEAMAGALGGFEWIDPEPQMPLPNGWDCDYDAVRAGLDFSNPDLTDQDYDRLRTWYLDTIGEVPPHVDFLACHDPRTLKAARSRWENCLTVLPKQSLPYTMLGFDALRMSAHGIRENALLCRAWGVSKAATIGAISAAMEYGGTDNISVAAEAARDVFDSWD